MLVKVQILVLVTAMFLPGDTQCSVFSDNSQPPEQLPEPHTEGTRHSYMWGLLAGEGAQLLGIASSRSHIFFRNTTYMIYICTSHCWVCPKMYSCWLGALTRAPFSPMRRYCTSSQRVSGKMKFAAAAGW